MKTHPYDILQELGATSGKNDKLAILKREGDNPLWKYVCELALDPFINFGMSKAPVVTKHTKLSTHDDLGFALKQIRQVLSKEKLRGHAARDWMITILTNLDERAADVVCRVIAKDLDCGVETAVNKVWKNFIQEWPVMLCDADGDKEDKDIAQLKEDGMRLNIMVERKSVTYFSRSGREYDFHGRFDKLFIQMAGGDDMLFDGEGLIKLKDGSWMPRKAGNGIIKKAGLKGISMDELDGLRFALWDVIPLSDWKKGHSEVQYKHRLLRLMGMVEGSKSEIVSVVPTVFIKSPAEAQVLFDKYVSQGFEGLILKNSRGPWENDRVSHQIKMKAEREADLKVVGTEPHSKNPKLIGALICETEDGLLRTGVGSGLDDEWRAKSSAWWMGKIVAVVYNEIIEDRNTKVKSMFLPRIVEVREDKKRANKLSELV